MSLNRIYSDDMCEYCMHFKEDDQYYPCKYVDSCMMDETFSGRNVVEVIFCKHCSHSVRIVSPIYYKEFIQGYKYTVIGCEFYEEEKCDDDFCSRAERRVDDATNRCR